MTKFTFAIMGATGHIGHILTEELLKKGHKVRALGRDAHRLQELKSKGAEILSGDFTDSILLSQAFKGCHAVFSFIPPGYDANDFEVFRDETGKAIAQAIVKAKISHVLNLSSIGAHLSSGTGPIKELHLHEERLNLIQNVNVLHFRPSYFM
ncbi:MAG: NAD(P)H-binding protein, partial [Anaerolineae bacterium]